MTSQSEYELKTTFACPTTKEYYFHNEDLTLNFNKGMVSPSFIKNELVAASTKGWVKYESEYTGEELNAFRTGYRKILRKMNEDFEINHLKIAYQAEGEKKELDFDDEELCLDLQQVKHISIVTDEASWLGASSNMESKGFTSMIKAFFFAHKNNRKKTSKRRKIVLT
eukprot:UN28578